MSLLSSSLKYGQLAFDLREYLRDRISLEESKQVIRTRLRDRQSNFLTVTLNGIYKNPSSPYLKLLKHASCEYGDIESMVKKDGIEATLSRLYKQGVYLSWEEFKGKSEVVRGSSSFQFKETDFENPLVGGYFQTQSSRIRSSGTMTMFNFRHQLAKNYYHLPMLAVNNALDAPMGLWESVLPSIAGIAAIMSYWKIDKPVVRWFSPMTEDQAQAQLKHILATRFILFSGKIFREKTVNPEYVNLAQAIKVAQWIATMKKQFGSCSLSSMVSLAVKVCQAARENGLDIEGTHFFTSGEPLTETKRQFIEATGAAVVSRYFLSELSFIGCSCPYSNTADEIHFFHDAVALIQRQRKVENSKTYVNAFLFTSLLSSNPKIFLNVGSDDYGVLEKRNCGCLFDELGFNDHLYNIRSFAKLTGKGMTIIGSDFVRILEDSSTTGR